MQQSKYIENSPETKKVLEILDRWLHQINIEKNNVKSSIESSSTSRIRKWATDPESALLDTYFEADIEIETELIVIPVIKYVKFFKEHIISAKYITDDSNVGFFILLKEDNDQLKDEFYKISYRLMQSELGRKFSIKFHFVTETLFDELPGQIIM